MKNTKRSIDGHTLGKELIITNKTVNIEADEQTDEIFLTQRRG
jgi:hypothetical protein